MRLPWVQVDQSAFARAEELAAILEIETAQALGHLVMLWRWALDLGPEDEPPMGIAEGRVAVVRLEAGSGWKGQRGALFGALVDLGLVEGDAESLRVRGLDRYQAVVSKRAADRARKAALRSGASAGSRAEVARTSDGRREESRGKTQTQTQTQIDLPDGRSHPLPPQGGRPESLGQLAEAWNEITSPPLPRVEQMPPDRKKRAKAALQRRPLAEWRAVFSAVEASGFCRGEDGGWKASFDWAIKPGGVKPEPAIGLLEGAYARAGPPRNQDVRKGVVRAEDALARMEPAGEVLL